MTNSGSSANLLALSAIVNPLFKNSLKINDEVLIPAICWSTSLWPIVQLGLKPIFVDVDLKTLSINTNTIQEAISEQTRGIVLVHCLGFNAISESLLDFVKKRNIFRPK